MALLNNIGNFPGLAEAAEKALAYAGVAGDAESIILNPINPEEEIRITLYNEMMEQISQACYDASLTRIYGG